MQPYLYPADGILWQTQDGGSLVGSVGIAHGNSKEDQSTKILTERLQPWDFGRSSESEGYETKGIVGQIGNRVESLEENYQEDGLMKLKIKYNTYLQIAFCFIYMEGR